MTHQTSIRAKHASDRFDYVVGKSPQLISGKGKYYLLNFAGMKEAYDKAVIECPIAADAILVLIWDAVHQYNTLEALARDFEKPSSGEER